MSEESSIFSPRSTTTRPLHEEHPPVIHLRPLSSGKQLLQLRTNIINNNHDDENENENENNTTMIASANSNNLETTNQGATRRNKFRASWHSASDMPQRKLILKEIVRSIHRRRPSAPSSMKMQLPMMAKKMEEALYKHAPSKEIYQDFSTLDDRLEELARKVQEQAEAMKKNREQQQLQLQEQEQEQEQEQLSKKEIGVVDEKKAHHDHHNNAARTTKHHDNHHNAARTTRHHHKDPRIVGGVPIASGEFPYYVSIQDDCGGALIGKKVVLTAAHCTNPEWKGKTVIVGGTGVNEVKGGGVEVKMEDYVNYPEYCDNCHDDGTAPGTGSGSWHNDIALVFLAEEVDIDTPIKYSLAEDLPPVGTLMTVVGQGKVKDSDDPSAYATEVGKVNLQMVSEGKCNEKEWYNNTVKYPLAFCAGAEKGKSHCDGDSGGPLTVINGDEHIQYGVVSGSDGCGEKPGVYSSTLSVYEWIKNSTCDKGFDSVVCENTSGDGNSNDGDGDSGDGDGTSNDGDGDTSGDGDGNSGDEDGGN